MKIPIIDSESYDIRVRRRKPGGVEKWDKAAEIEDDKTEEEMLKFQSDGTKIPKPDDNKFSTMEYNKWYHKLFGGKNYVKAVDFIDYGDGSGEFMSIDYDEAKAEASGTERMFETHRNLMAQKYADLFSEKDNTQLWMAGYLGALALVTAGMMYFFTTGVENAVKQGISSGVQAGIEASKGAAQSGATNVPGGG